MIPTTPSEARGNETPCSTRLDRVLAAGAKSSPTPDFVPVLIALAATIIGVLVLAYIWTFLNNRAEVAAAAKPVSAFGNKANQPYGPGDAVAAARHVSGAATATTTAPRPRMPSFALVTQFGETMQVAFPRERPLILAVGDRSSARYVEDWIDPLKRRYADAFGRTFDVHGVADLSDVASATRSVAVLVIRNRTDFPVMLDWHGELAETLAVDNGKLAVFVVCNEGRITARLAGRPTQSRLTRLTEAIDTVLDETNATSTRTTRQADAHR